MHLHDARVLVIGLGVSGEAAAGYCAASGAQVTVTDTAAADTLRPALGRLARHPIRFRLGADPPEVAGYDLLVRSPGVPDQLPALAAARAAGVPVWSETELGYLHCPCPLIAVTGTNGKGTTTTLTTAMLRRAGRTAYAAGNIGTPLTAVLPQLRGGDVVVLEVSAAQLENSHRLAPAIAVLTNIAPEHQDLYSWDYYRTLKARIVRHHTPASVTVANHDDPTCQAIADGAAGRRLFTSSRGPLPAGMDGVYVADRQIIARCAQAEVVLCDLDELPVRGCAPSVLPAAAAALAAGVDQAAIRHAIRAYRGREHVLEHVGAFSGVDVFNDAKATNPYSVLHALRALADRDVVLVAGGRDDKHADFSVLTEPIARHVVHLVAFGPTAAPLAAAAGRPPVQTVDTFTEAVSLACRVARSGQVLLFSPGTYSRHLDPDYLARGVLFKQLVHQLAAGPAASLIESGGDQV